MDIDRTDIRILEALQRNAKLSHACDEILDCMAVTGQSDYILRIVVPDLVAFAKLITGDLIKLTGVKMVRSTIGLRRIKRSHAMPLTYLMAFGEQRPKVRFHESSAALG